MKHPVSYIIALFMSFILAQPALADEIYAGVAVHAIDSPLSMETGEGGTDFQIGYRGDGIEALSFIGSPSPYVFASINSDGDTSMLAAGISWKFGDKIYIRPGIGLAIHDGPSLRIDNDGWQTQLGSRVLFEPELSVGIRLSERVDLEASWVHVSHAGLFNRGQNPGLDNVGVRLVIKLP